MDVKGNLILDVYNGLKTSGTYQFEWHGQSINGLRVSGGVYFFKIFGSNGSIFIEKMIMLK